MTRHGYSDDIEDTMATTAFQKWRTEWQAFRKSLLPEASDEPLKAGDWVVTPEGIGFITRVDASFTDGTTTDPLPFRVKFNKGHTLCYASGELRRARPDEIPQPVNINACDNPSGPCACGAWHNESDKPCDGDSFTPGKPVEQAQPLQLREGAWYQLRKGLVVGPLSPNAHGTYKWIDPKTGMNWTDAGKWWRNGQESDNDIEREVPAPSEPTTEQLTDEQVSAELKSAGIDMQPAFERLHKMFDEHKQKQPDADGWIEWHGGEMPVDGEQLVSRRCLDVSIPSGPYLASSLRWTHVGNRYDITHYRLVQPANELCKAFGARTSEPTAEPDVDGWIEWHGGDDPVSPQALVLVRWRKGHETTEPQPAGIYSWHHCDDYNDIVAYRLVQPAPKYRPFASAAEFSPHRDRWLRYKHNESGTAGRASWTTASGIEIGKHSFGWTTLFHDYVFDDNGQPCGIEVK